MNRPALFLPDHVGLSSLLAYVGMVLILAAFVAETRNRMSSRGTPYLSLMAVGSALLALRAAHVGEWAFLMLEAIWFGAALWALGAQKAKASR